MTARLSLAEPHLRGNERAYVLDCIDSNWISSIGKYIARFEEAFAEFSHVRHAISTNNGTTALHLALAALGVQPGDEVLVPTLTFVATANAVQYCGATPVLVDVCDESLNIDPNDAAAKITERTKGIIAVHLYGQPAAMEAINRLAREHDLFVIEDAAEAHGAEVEGRRVGSLGTCGTFSFFGNKIVTTGEGGMITTNDDDLAAHMRQLRGQGMDTKKRYWFPIVGYNYRMTNIAAAIGVGQMETIDEAIRQRDELGALYEQAFGPLAEQVEVLSSPTWARSVYWMYNVFLREGGEERRDAVMRHLDEMGIETRPVFYPMHQMPPYRSDQPFPVADRRGATGITLPMHQGLNGQDIERVAESLAKALANR